MWSLGGGSGRRWGRGRRGCEGAFQVGAGVGGAEVGRLGARVERGVEVWREREKSLPLSLSLSLSFSLFISMSHASLHVYPITSAYRQYDRVFINCDNIAVDRIILLDRPPSPCSNTKVQPNPKPPSSQCSPSILFRTANFHPAQSHRTIPLDACPAHGPVTTGVDGCWVGAIRL